jgi:hypothetical protein
MLYFLPLLSNITLRHDIRKLQEMKKELELTGTYGDTRINLLSGKM